MAFFRNTHRQPPFMSPASPLPSAIPLDPYTLKPYPAAPKSHQNLLQPLDPSPAYTSPFTMEALYGPSSTMAPAPPRTLISGAATSPYLPQPGKGLSDFESSVKKLASFWSPPLPKSSQLTDSTLFSAVTSRSPISPSPFAPLSSTQTSNWQAPPTSNQEPASLSFLPPLQGGQQSIYNPRHTPAIGTNYGIIIPDLSKYEEMSIAEIKREYRKIARYGDWLGYNVAADNLRHFLDGHGISKYIESDWLLNFPIVREACDINIGRFLTDGNSTIKAALAVIRPNQSTNVSDLYKHQVRAKLRSKLYYASAYSTLTTTGDFRLDCDEDGNVDIDGTVYHEWTDRYDWQEGEYAAFKILGKTYNIPDDAAIRLVNAGEAHNFDMISIWQEGVGWFIPFENR